MLEILGKPTSINVRKVLWLCVELGLPYRLEPWGSGLRATDTADFLALNPNGLVPVIRDGDSVLWESNTILRYLAAREHREDLLPSAPLARARIEQWMDWQAGELNNAWRYVFMARVRNSPAHRDPDAIAASAALWNRHMAILEAQLARGKGWVSGENFSLADIVLGLSANRWRMTPIDRPDLPAVSVWFELLSQRPGFMLHGANGAP